MITIDSDNLGNMLKMVKICQDCFEEQMRSNGRQDCNYILCEEICPKIKRCIEQDNG